MGFPLLSFRNNNLLGLVGLVHARIYTDKNKKETIVVSMEWVYSKYFSYLPDAEYHCVPMNGKGFCGLKDIHVRIDERLRSRKKQRVFP